MLPQCLGVLALTLLFWYFIGTPIQFPASVVGAGLLAVLMLWGIRLAADAGPVERWAHLQFTIVVSLALCIPIYSAIRAKLHFEQPLAYGALADRHWWGIVAGPVIYSLITSGNVSAGRLTESLVLLSWLSLLAFTAAVGFFLANEEAGIELFDMTAISNLEGRGLRVKFPVYAIVFGAMHYLVMATRERTFLNLLKSGLFVFYVAFIARGRIDIACLGLALSYALFASGLYRRWRIIICVGVIYGLLAILLTQLTADRYAPQRIVQDSLAGRTTSDLMKIIEGGDPVDPGLEGRKRSFQLVVDDLMESPTLLIAGSGKVSNRWKDGFSGALGVWFYPAELGFIGAIFVYGIVLFAGLSAYCLYLAARAMSLSAGDNSITATTLRLMIVFLLIQFIGGMPLLYPTQVYFTVFACLALGSSAISGSVEHPSSRSEVQLA